MLNPLVHGFIIFLPGLPGSKVKPHAIEYALEWCAQTYQAAVVSGNASVKLISTEHSPVKYGGFETLGDENLIAQPLPGSKESILAPALTVAKTTQQGLSVYFEGFQGGVQLVNFHGITSPEPNNSIVDSIYTQLYAGNPDDPLGTFMPVLDNVAVEMTNR